MPETTRTPEGFTVDGASPELLSDLLDAYASELKSRSRRIYDLMMPGLSAAEIEDSFGAIGLVPPAEAVVWWQWRNGYQPMIGHGMRHAQLTLANAITLYRKRSLGLAEDQWNPDWVLVAGEANSGHAICCRPSDKPPLVRSASTFALGTQDDEDTLHQVVSLCTPITWRLLAILKGWDEYDHGTGFWGWDYSRYPLEWKLTDLM